MSTRVVGYVRVSTAEQVDGCLRATSSLLNKRLVTCPVCGRGMTAGGLTRHRRRQHGDDR